MPIDKLINSFGISRNIFFAGRLLFCARLLNFHSRIKYKIKKALPISITSVQSWLVLLVFFICVTVCGCKGRKTTFVTIGTGAVTGIYYPTGNAVSQMLNNKSTLYGIKVTVEATAGSVYNINAVLSGDLDIGIVQSDRQYQAYHGLAEWSDSGAHPELRSIFSVHSEAITLVASEKSDIRNVKDLEGKRINLGNIGSGQLQNARDVLSAIGLNEKDLQAEYVKAVEAPGLLQDERIDGFFYTVGHPNSNISEATVGRIRVLIIPINVSEISQLLTKYPYYTQTEIPYFLYPNAINKENIETIGVKTTFVTSNKVSEDVVYALTREVFENLEDFKIVHPAYSGLTKQNMLQGLTAPIHRGAWKYYKETGLDKYIADKIRPDSI